jgi:hypothetical protein
VLAQAKAAADRQLVAQKRAAEVMTIPLVAEKKEEKQKNKRIQKMEAAARQQVAQQRATQGMTTPLSLCIKKEKKKKSQSMLRTKPLTAKSLIIYIYNICIYITYI